MEVTKDVYSQNKLLPAKPQSIPLTPITLPVPPVPAKNMTRHAVKAHSSRVIRRARAEFIAMRSRILKPLEEKIKGLEDKIVVSEARMAAVNEELTKASTKGGLGAIRRSELSRELKELAEKIDSCYSQLDAAMKTYDAEKKKYSDG
ncbi:MAG: hypothetical protein Q8R14_00155 [Candidatus Omnitrophota bacterium]|nr:hypothetical protein [Candidatus Omnitrophota bacterium]